MTPTSYPRWLIAIRRITWLVGLIPATIVQTIIAILCIVILLVLCLTVLGSQVAHDGIRWLVGAPKLPERGCPPWLDKFGDRFLNGSLGIWKRWQSLKNPEAQQ